ncbi:MAG: hypothetical protein NTX65_13000 [Ignavibacteriales bacterium]|nr:hypothetical protein [Ignavibacteriales bacterium]
MIIKKSVMLLLIVFSFLFLPAKQYAEGKETKKRVSKTTLGSPNTTRLNINNISTFFRSDGDSDDLDSNNAGFFFPKGSGKTAAYESGLLWGARINGSATDIKVGGNAYVAGLQPGKILSPGVAESPNLPKNRIYRVRPDYKTADLTMESRDEGVPVAEIYNQYDLDWKEWPWQDGAPFEDKDGDKRYNPDVDIPGVPGASQSIWYVANDLDATKTTALHGSQPMGIEEQGTMWAYSQAGPLGNMIFRKYLLINKSTDTFRDMYVSMFSDIDLGFSDDDMAGCDTTLSLGYVYNSSNHDSKYGTMIPPATGFDFFQGPIVNGSATDTAIFRGKKIAGKRNLPMTAFYYFAKGDPAVSDPPNGTYQGTTEFYNFFQGRIGRSGEPFRTPARLGATATPFTLSGDPVAGTGWLDGEIISTSDRRIGSASGPFNMAPGDTQEVVVAQICAMGTDYLNSVTLLKAYDRVAQDAYNNFFQIPSGAALPIVTASGLDKEVILSWGDPTAAAQTENYSQRGYNFEGYNVYQLPLSSSLKTDAKLIATYDLVNNIKVLYDYVFDSRTGTDERVPVQFGKDSGISRSIDLTQDYVRTGQPLYNGSEYYYSVTSYSYNPDPLAIPQVLENPITSIRVTPKSPNPGVRYTNTYDNSVSGVTHTSKTSSKSDGNVIVSVKDPSRVTGHTYKVTFEKVGTTNNIVWNVTDITTGAKKASNITNQSGDNSYPIIDGLEIKVTGPPNDFTAFKVTANANGSLNPPEIGTYAFNSNGFPLYNDEDRPAARQQIHAGVWGIATGMTAANDGSYAYFLTRSPREDNFTRIIPYDFEIRFTSTGSKANFAWTDGVTKQIPFEIWNTGIGTPSDPTDDYKLCALIYDIDEDGVFSLDKLDHGLSGGNDDTETDWIYIYDVADHTPGTKGYDAVIAADYDAGATSTMGGEILARLVLVSWNNGSVSAADYPANLRATMPEQGTIFRIETTKPNSVNDEFTFTAPANSNDVDLAKDDVKKINVFPNPYYGVNTQEQNKYFRWITFSHLPNRATIRIVNIAGEMIRVIEKDNNSQFERWDLLNGSGLPAASGLYIAFIEMPDLGVTKTLKFSIVQEQQILDKF